MSSDQSRPSPPPHGGESTCRTNRVGDEMIALMEARGRGVGWTVCSLDLWMSDAVANAGVMLWRGMSPDRTNRQVVGTAWLRRDGRFERSLINAYDTRRRPRRLTLFTLKPEFRP